MRKLTIVLAAAALAASSTGCVGRCKNWFQKGSPCGTLLSAPAVLSGPVAMGAPMGAPIMQPNLCYEQQPMCVPCDPCMQYDPCAPTGVSAGYFGGYLSGGADCGCDSNVTGAIMTPSTLAPVGAAGPYPNPVP